MTLGEYLAKYRDLNNLTQKQLGARFGVSKQTISKWEKEQAFPEPDKILQISNILDVPVHMLIDADDLEKVDVKREIYPYLIGINVLYQSVHDYRSFYYFFDSFLEIVHLILPDYVYLGAFYRDLFWEKEDYNIYELPEDLEAVISIHFNKEKHSLTLTLGRILHDELKMRKLNIENISIVKPSRSRDNNVYGFEFYSSKKEKCECLLILLIPYEEEELSKITLEE